MRTSIFPASLKAASQRAHVNHLAAYVRRIFLLIMLVFVSAGAKADDNPGFGIIVEDYIVDDFGYCIEESYGYCYATLTHGVVLYGDAVIPSHITYEGVEYPVLEIGEYAFSWCSITSVTIPNTVTRISEGAFENCKNLSTVTLGENVALIFQSAFADCTNLKEINFKTATMPGYSDSSFQNVPFSNVTICVPMGAGDVWQNSEFADWHATIIEDEALGYVNVDIDGMLYNIKMDSKVAELVKGKDVKHIVIPSTITHEGKEYPVTTVCGGAIVGFDEVEVMTIGSNVETLMSGSIYCDNLRHVYCYATTPPDANDAFPMFYTGEMTLYIPEGTRSAYLANYYLDWGEFGHIYEFDANGDPIIDETETMTIEELRAAYKAMRSGDFNLDGTVTVKDITDIVDLILGKEKK